MRRSMKRVNQFTFPIKKGVLSLINEKFEGKNVLNYKGNNLKKEYVVYLIYYIVKMTDAKEEEGVIEVVNLNSKILRKNFVDRYKPYLSYLEEINLIWLPRYYSVGNHSNMYAFTDKYYELERGLINFKIDDVILLKKVNSGNKEHDKEQLKKRRYCEKTRGHLVKSFNSNLEMDIEGATNEVSTFDARKYAANIRRVHEYEAKKWKYQINPQTDNRLHTNITWTNNKLLKYITYKNKKLSEVDIKTSQPLLMFVILKNIFDDSMNNESTIFLEKKLGVEFLGKIKSNGIDFEELNNFGDVILNKDLYNYLVSRVEIKKDNNEYYYIDRSVKTNKKVYFNSKRDLIKSCMMRALYNGIGPEITSIKKQFKSIFNVADLINKHKKISESKSNLSHVLQSFEAHVLLDLIAKDISVKYKDIPLFSKHDSLITYKSKIDEVRDFTQKQFKIYTGIDAINFVVKNDSFS